MLTDCTKLNFTPEISSVIQTGDAIVFRGRGFVSDAIELLTGDLSHFASCILISGVPWLVESTILDGKKGVQLNMAEPRIAQYDIGTDGAVYLLRLSDDERAKMDTEQFRVFLYAQIGKPYDKLLIAHLFFDRFQLVPARPNWQSWICSELGAEAAEKSGILPASIDAAEITPTMMARFRIWSPVYYQLRGPRREIKEFSTIPAPGR